ncbi:MULTISPECIES: hypothetical protein [unclassified Streptomyces]|uniref:hypothetical protein n=1 Tax=unclassified Streptomyces TaxID=2593676 RepID=UPI002E28D1E3|nr:hypothetical protein [Streptomyces sp. NBC_00228]
MPRRTAERPADRHHVTVTATITVIVTGQKSMIARRAESAHWGYLHHRWAPAPVFFVAVAGRLEPSEGVVRHLP